MVDEFDFEALQRDLQETIAKGRAAFDGEDQDELNDLPAWSETTPDDVTDLQKQQELIAIAKEANRINLKLAVLKRLIEKLGDIAAALARKSLH